MTTRRLVFYIFIPVLVLLTSVRLSSAQEVVLYASQAPVKVGNWSAVADSTAAGGARLANPDLGAPKITTPAANPADYAELTFNATAGTPYRLWIRGKTLNNSPYNDSVYIQFSGSVDSAGTPIYRIGTTSATDINLEDCYGCGLSGWGWQDNGWGVGVLGPQIFFQSTGTQTIRIQVREDGLSIDQIVLSPSSYLYSAPGAVRNDTTILPQNSGAIISPTPTPTPTPTPVPTSASDVVIWASDVPAGGIHGNWFKQSDSTAAGQILIRNPDLGAAKLMTPLANPTDYFEVSFPAQAGTPYRLWIRSRAENNFWGNDSVFIQFSDSLTNGSAAYRIGTTSAAEMNLEDCSGCGEQGWGWQDNGWGVGVLGPVLQFASSGSHTIRIQVKEDGLSIDQIVLSPSAYLYSSPGALKNDSTYLQSTIQNIVAPNQPPFVSISATPTSGNSPLFVSFFSNAGDPDGNIASYAWDFGNGTTSGAANPTTTYQSAGTYIARLTVYDNAGASTTAAIQINVTAPPPPPPPPTSATLRVLSWNLDFGTGTDGVRDLNRTATYIANKDPDLAGVCEMPSDQIGTLLTYLTQKTGRNYFWTFIQKYDGTTEGNLILSKYSFISTSGRYLSYQRSVAQATVSIGGRTINFFATHLDPDSSTVRYQQVGELMSFMSNFSESRIVVGDFNAGPDTSESILMTGTYYDSWMQGMNMGTASAYADNPVWAQTRTRRGRIDYIFYSRSSPNLVLQDTQIPDVRNLSQTNVVVFLGTLDDKGVRPSDHNMTVANFQIR